MATGSVSPPRKRRFYQFGLATFFGVVAIVACWLGYVVNRACNQQVAVDLVHKLGGRVYYDYQTKPGLAKYIYRNPDTQSVTVLGGSIVSDETPPGATWLRKWIGEHYFQNLVYIYAPGARITDSDLAQLCRVSTIQSLDLNRSSVSDTGMAHLKRLTQLKVLFLNGVPITDDGLAHAISGNWNG
jgi:hypothetical protein